METLLNENRSETAYSHTSMITPRGKFFITRSYIENFYNLYQIDKFGLTENPQHQSMLRFDFDIKVKADDYKNQVRFYSDKDLKYIIGSINNAVIDVIDFKGSKPDKQLMCCLLEKDIYLKQSKNVYSGGFHLQYPYIFTTSDAIVSIIDRIKEDVKANTGIEFDAGVYKNPWLMYGSKKDIELKPYLLTRTFDVELNQMTAVEAFKDYNIYDVNEDVIQINESNVDSLLPRILSINTFGRDMTYDALPNKVVAPKLKFIEKPKRADNREIDEKLKEAEKLLSLLKSSRVDEYHEWMTIGWILYSICEGCQEGLELWDKVSQKSDSYNDETACEVQWSGMKVGKYTIATLHKFAKEDSPLQYETLFKKKDSWVKNLINNLTDTYCAEVFKERNNGEVFYTASNGWVIYNSQTRFWTLKNDKSSLSYIVSKFFSNVLKEYHTEYTKSYKPGDKEDDKFYQLIIATRKKVEMSKFSAGVISQLQCILSENANIMNKFDSKPELFAFECGNLYNLKTKEVRQINKDDYIVTHCGYSLPKRDEAIISKVMSLIQTICKDKEQLKSVLSMLSLFVYGNNINELFFVLTGTGRNGKGLLDTFLEQSLGLYYKAVDMKQFTHYEKDSNRANSEIASCQFARCLSASESETNKDNKLITSQIKKYSGNDQITARFLNKDSFTFKPRFTMVLNCNDIPSLSAMDGGIQSRMKIIELPFTFITDADRELASHEKLADTSLKTKIANDKTYRDAFLYILFDTWHENNGQFYENQDVKEYTNNYFETQNPVKEWFQASYQTSEKNKVRSSEMFAECDLGITMTQFGRYMKEFCKSTRSKDGMYYFCERRKYNMPEEGIEL